MARLVLVLCLLRAKPHLERERETEIRRERETERETETEREREKDRKKERERQEEGEGEKERRREIRVWGLGFRVSGSSFNLQNGFSVKIVSVQPFDICYSAFGVEGSRFNAGNVCRADCKTTQKRGSLSCALACSGTYG